MIRPTSQKLANFIIHKKVFYPKFFYDVKGRNDIVIGNKESSFNKRK